MLRSLPPGRRGWPNVKAVADVELAADGDLTQILVFLADSYAAFGEPPADALAHARTRVSAVRREVIAALTTQPFRGTRREDLLPGFRQVTIGRAVPCFVHDEAADRVTILALFWDGQDHLKRMSDRLVR